MNGIAPTCWTGAGVCPLFDFLFGFVAVTRYDGILEGFVLFVLHLQGFPFEVDEGDFDLAVGPVVAIVGGAVGDDVLVADGVVDLGEDVGEFSLKDWGEVHASSHLGEGFELVLSLEVVQTLDTGSHAHATAGVDHFLKERPRGDGEDGDVGSGFDLSEDFVEGEFGEGVAPRTDEDDVFSAFDTAGAIECFVEGVEEVGVGESGNLEGLEGLGDEILVVGEVGEDVGAQVVGDDGDIVFGPEGLEEGVGGVLHVVDEVVAIGCELQEHDCGDGRLGGSDAGDDLGDSILDDTEVLSLEAGYELVGLI